MEGGKVGQAEGIANDEKGLGYLTDTMNSKIIVFTQQNRFVREWKVPAPLMIAVAGERVFVTSTPGVSVHTTDGTPIGVRGRYGHGP